MRKKQILMRTGKKSIISRKKVIISTGVVVLSLCALMVGLLSAKYLDKKESTGLVRAKNFYFTSNLLDGNTHTLAPGTTSVTFTLGNHEDDLRYSELDIKYEYTVKADSADGVTTAEGEGTLARGDIHDAKINVSGLQPGKTYIVTAVGRGGYSKTLTATIVVPENVPQLHQHQENPTGEYILLTVWNEGDASGKVTIEYTGIPDNTNPNMTDWHTNESHEVEIEPHTSKVFRFFSETTVNVKDEKGNVLN